FFFSSRRRHTRSYGDWSSDVCSSDLEGVALRRSAEAYEQDPDRRVAGVAEAVRRPAKEQLPGDDGWKRDQTRPGCRPLARSTEQIGRASCRERGEVGGVAVAVVGNTV